MQASAPLPVRPVIAVIAVLSAALGCAAIPGPLPGREAPALRDVAYRDAGAETLRLDVTVPDATRFAGRRPAVLLFHPGGWTGGRKELMHGAASTLARAGFVAVSVQYRLAPAHPFPAQLEDAQAAVRWLRRHADRLNVDGARVGAFGYSAGAHLAALLATAPAAGAEVQAVAVGGTPADLRALPPNGRTVALLGASAEEAPARYDDASPVTHVSTDDPPFSILHGRTDWMVDIEQSRALRDALHERGVPTRYRESRLGHFAIFLLQDGGAALAARFFDEFLGDESALAATRASPAGSRRDTTAARPARAAPPAALRAAASGSPEPGS
jgi:acetyl esterase/lipase